MITSEERDKVAKLPTWVRDLVRRLMYLNAPLEEECSKLRRKASAAEESARRLREANHALMELLGKAGQAGLNWASETVRVLEGYEIFQSKTAEG